MKVYSHSAQLFDTADSNQTDGGNNWMKMWVSDGSTGYTEIAKSDLTLECVIGFLHGVVLATIHGQLNRHSGQFSTSGQIANRNGVNDYLAALRTMLGEGWTTSTSPPMLGFLMVMGSGLVLSASL